MSDGAIAWKVSPVWRFAESFPRRGYTLQVYVVAQGSNDWTWAIHMHRARIGPAGTGHLDTFRSRDEAQAECERQYWLLRRGRDASEGEP